MKRRFKALIIVGGILLTIGAFLLTVNIIPPKKVIENNIFIRDPNSTKPMLAAHRGGSLTNPENTLKAYKAAVSEYKIDIVESDIWLTKDETLTAGGG